MVDNPVAEIGGYYLALYRQLVYETYARTYLVSTILQPLFQRQKLVLQPALELQLVNRVPLVSAGVEIRLAL
jgi:hypothetical protein